MKKNFVIRILIKVVNLLRHPIKKYRFNSGFKNKFIVQYEKTPNSLSELCDKYGSDKGSRNLGVKPFPWKPHSYTDYYEHLFASKKELVTKVFECGIGTNNINLISNMSAGGKPGASLRVWRDYFTNATIYGAEIDRDILFQESRIITKYMNQLDPVSINNFWCTLALKDFDLMIDDGLHTFEAGVTLFENSIQNLDQNGTYIIEDVNLKSLPRFRQYFKQSRFHVEYITFFSPNSKVGNPLLLSIRK